MIEQALVFIGSAVLLVPIFQRLGLGSILGYLIAGMIVGPQGLRLIRDSESAMHLAELGVILLLFMIGLEIQPRKLWSMRHHLFGLGASQIVATMILFTGAGLALGYPLVTSAVLGFALSLSSTAFALQTLAEQNQLTTTHGRASFSVLLMQDLVAIPALAIIPALGTSKDVAAPTLRGSLLVVAIIILLIVASRYLMRPAFRFIASIDSREIFTAATLFIVLGVAVLMQSVGLSAALGTFIAGVLLADSEYRHELESDLEPFKSLLMGLFFIGVGMGVNLHLIADRPLFIFGLSVVYLTVKFAMVFLVSNIFGLNRENSKMTALTIAQGGEFAFVIFGIASTYGLAESELIATLSAVITISMALNPVLMILNEKYLDWRSDGGFTPEYDEIKGEEPEVIIAGFGRFGQTFGRILRAQGIPFVSIDHDADQIELLRRFGNKVYYGDASRSDLLAAAGAAKAKYFVLAIDDVETSLKTAETVLSDFPNLKIFARARNRGHFFELRERGITMIKREMFDSSAFFVGDLLVDMGVDPERATILIENFRRHDEIMLEEQFKVRTDDKMFLNLAKQGNAQLAEVLKQDSLQSYVGLTRPKHAEPEAPAQSPN